MKRTIKIALLACTTLLCIELLLRVPPLPRYAANWVFDSLLGNLGPRHEQVMLHGIPLHYNQYGFRGPQPGQKQRQQAAQNKIKNVVVLGDSYTEALEMPWQGTYVAQLAKLLTAGGSKFTHTVALAKSDFSTTQAALAFTEYGRRYNPRQVVLQFFGLNDFVNNGLAFTGYSQGAADFSRPYVDVNSSALTEPGDRRDIVMSKATMIHGLPIVYPQPTRRWLRANFRLFAWLEALYVPYVGTKLERLNKCKPEIQVFLTAQNADWQAALEATRLSVQQIRKQAGSAGLLAVYFPSEYEVSEKLFARTIARSIKRCHPGEEFAAGEAEAKFIRVMDDLGVRTLTLTPLFRTAIRGGAELYLPGGHFNRAGHRLAAEAISAALLAKK